jgi:hypothetical protein
LKVSLPSAGEGIGDETALVEDLASAFFAAPLFAGALAGFAALERETDLTVFTAPRAFTFFVAFFAISLHSRGSVIKRRKYVQWADESQVVAWLLPVLSFWSSQVVVPDLTA